MHIAMADEDENELIHWKEFLPIGIRIIRTIYSRNLSGKFPPIGEDDSKSI
jgi:hypothetical protein